ncbi:MAG: UPF0182 family protein [Chloroflexota bacterium]
MSSFDSQWQRWFPEDGNRTPPSGSYPRWANATVILVLVGILFSFLLANILKSMYTEWLWFSHLDYADVYMTILKTRVTLFFAAAGIFGLLFLGNLLLAAHLTPRADAQVPWAMMKNLQPVIRVVVILGTVLLSLMFGMIAQGNWETVLRFLHGQSFGIADPIFQKDIGYYVFSLPFFELVRDWLQGAFIMTALACAGVYALSYAVQRLKFDFARRVLAHMGGLAIAIVVLFGSSYWFAIWNLVYSSRGVGFGASYADIHAKLPAQWIMMAVMLVLIGIILVSIIRRDFRLPLYGVAGWLAAALIIDGIFPYAIQRFQVEPNELVTERPYIEYNIEFTRKAFALDRIEEESFPADEIPSPEDITQNQGTINNIRLWDPRPLKDTYNQIQSIRLYYDFNDVDIDRYLIDDQYRQVMLSARELSAEKLASEAQTWVNRKLQFTHGYGIAMSPVNEIGAQGLPVLLVKDIPPAGSLTIEKPQIYFGEKTNDYVLVNTDTQEFDYPMGTENVYGYYEGNGGVILNSFIRRLVYAWHFGDFNLLISNEMTPQSRVIYNRNIQVRVKQLAPFLELDADPYVVAIEGRLYWIQDAYTTTNRYPYSEPFGHRLNYIRNSVKAVIDAYDGGVTFYVTDPEDALIQTYQSIFPGLFVPAEEMPESVRIHMRYPEDMFNIQSSVYQSYHMRDARVFYNKEDLWTVPKEFYVDREQLLEPYYTIMRLPMEEKEEFLLMLPFTPVNKNNTIGWLAARCDGDNYGKLLAYLFPKDKLVYGPSQIENRIQQDTVITEQFALWSRGGSRVIRGNLLLIPLATSKLYVEPVFLQADSGGLPELKRVIVAAGEKIAMRPTLEESLAVIFGAKVSPVEPEAKPGEALPPDIISLIAEAQRHYDQAQEYLKTGDWSGYGDELKQMQSVLERLAELASVADE